MLQSVANGTGALLLLVALNPFIQFHVVTHSRYLPGREGMKEGKKKGRKVEKEKIRRGGKEQEERERKRMGRGNIQVNIYSLFLQG